MAKTDVFFRSPPALSLCLETNALALVLVSPTQGHFDMPPGPGASTLDQNLGVLGKRAIPNS
jgi:hypothetical protein